MLSRPCKPRSPCGPGPQPLPLPDASLTLATPGSMHRPRAGLPRPSGAWLRVQLRGPCTHRLLGKGTRATGFSPLKGQPWMKPSRMASVQHGEQGQWFRALSVPGAFLRGRAQWKTRSPCGKPRTRGGSRFGVRGSRPRLPPGLAAPHVEPPDHPPG